jgi:hypothetical protein
MLENQIVEHHARHFQVGVGEGAGGVIERDDLLPYVCWPFHSPHDR